MSTTHRHQCLIYEGPPSRHLPALAVTLKQKLNEKRRCLYLNSPTMVTGMMSYLASTGFDVCQHANQGSLILSSDRHHLLEARFDVDAMIASLKDAFHQALNDGYQGLWATGDMTWEFG